MGTASSTTFKLHQETHDDLQKIAMHLEETTGVKHNKTDALRYAIRTTVRTISRKKKKVLTK